MLPVNWQVRLVINRRPERQTQTWRVQTIEVGKGERDRGQRERERGHQTHGSTSDVAVPVLEVLLVLVRWVGGLDGWMDIQANRDRVECWWCYEKGRMSKRE